MEGGGGWVAELRGWRERGRETGGEWGAAFATPERHETRVVQNEPNRKERPGVGRERFPPAPLFSSPGTRVFACSGHAGAADRIHTLPSPLPHPPPLSSHLAGNQCVGVTPRVLSA